MAEIKLSIELDRIQRRLGSDRTLAKFMGRLLNQVLQAKLTEHLGAEPHERTPDRRGRRNGHYVRQLTTRADTLDLEVPRDRAGKVCILARSPKEPLPATIVPRPKT